MLSEVLDGRPRYANLGGSEGAATAASVPSRLSPAALLAAFAAEHMAMEG